MALVLAAMLALPSSARSDEPGADRIAAALLESVTVHVTPAGTRVPAASCRRAPEGCEARLRHLAAELVRASRAHGLDPWLLAALVLHESRADPTAVGAAGELGVGQLHPRGHHGRRLARACRRAPDRCSAAGVWLTAEHLRELLDRCGDVEAALGAYQAGRCGETDYTRRVLRRRDQLPEAMNAKES